jgi:tRNA pseudouridine32 synthase / 23S rRNA pseudouridine746 synthase
VVHRLDMATSGLMLMARGPAMQRALSKLFETRAIHKRYVAMVDGHLDSSPHWQLIDLPIALDWPNRPLRIIHPDGKPSRTRWRALQYDAATHTTRVELEPITGRSHQLRVHLQALGHPILGDALYAPPAAQAKAPRLMLHACALAFRPPASSATQPTDALLNFESTPGF